MMNIRTIIIDDNKEFLFELKRLLKSFTEIELVAEFDNILKAKKQLPVLKPDLVFLDIEMPYKTGFELMEELEIEKKLLFSVVFYTAYDKYTLEALRKSALDYLVKPVEYNDLLRVIERYKTKHEKPVVTSDFHSPLLPKQIIPLPIITGVRFIESEAIVCILFESNGDGDKPVWYVQLFTGEKFKLRTNVTAKQLKFILNSQNFIQLSKSSIVNKSYISIIEYKTHKCYLLPPFNTTQLEISRMHLSELRKQFDQF